MSFHVKSRIHNHAFVPDTFLLVALWLLPRAIPARNRTRVRPGLTQFNLLQDRELKAISRAAQARVYTTETV